MNMLPKNHHSLQTLTFPFVANQEINVPVNGTYFKYESGTGEISVKTAEGLNIKRDVGGAIKCSEFSELRIQDLSGADDTKIFTIGYGEIKDNSVSGTIDVDTIGSITDPIKIAENQNYATLDNRNFMGGEFLTPVAGNYPHVGLRNPVASGVNCIIEKVYYENDGYINGRIGQYYIEDVSILTASFQANRFLGSPDGEGVIVSGIHTSRYGTKILGSAGMPVNQEIDIIVPPGFTYLVSGSISSTLKPVNIFWREVLI